MSLTNKKILVTGATGFIGAHVVEELLSKKAKIYCTYRSLNPESYLAKKGLYKKVSLEKCDLSQKGEVEKLFKKVKFDLVFHLAARLRPTDFADAFENNIVPVVNILEASKDGGVKAVFLASSSRSLIQDLTDEKIKELSQRPYDFSKTIADIIAEHYIGVMPVITIRYANVFGPGDDLVKPLRLSSDIIYAIKHHQTFKPQGDGSKVLEFLYVKDVAKEFAKAAEKKYRSKTIVLKAPWKFSINDWVKLLKQVSKLKKTKTSLEKALQETYKY